MKIRGDFLYGTGAWDRIQKKIGYRSTAAVYGPGIQLAADNMPQGELIQVPLTRYTGRQNQVLLACHMEGVEADLGRKGFRKQVVDVCKSICSKIVRDNFSRIRGNLRTDDVRKGGLVKKAKVAGWKQELAEHEKLNPLRLESEHFFKPINEISITAEPSREQDVIALLNQLVAGGVIRGIRVVGTNERMTYDGAFRIRIGPNYSDHTYNLSTNPLGITSARVSEYQEEYPDGFQHPDLLILEYKYSIDGLIDDLGSGDKKASEIDLIIAWTIGEKYHEIFSAHSLLTEDGVEDRDYHGITHKLYDENGIHVMDAIVLEDLISYLDDPITEMEHQATKYEEE